MIRFASVRHSARATLLSPGSRQLTHFEGSVLGCIDELSPFFFSVLKSGSCWKRGFLNSSRRDLSVPCTWSKKIEPRKKSRNAEISADLAVEVLLDLPHHLAGVVRAVLERVLCAHLLRERRDLSNRSLNFHINHKKGEDSRAGLSQKKNSSRDGARELA